MGLRRGGEIKVGRSVCEFVAGGFNAAFLGLGAGFERSICGLGDGVVRTPHLSAGPLQFTQ